MTPTAIVMAGLATCVLSTDPPRDIRFPGVGEECQSAVAIRPDTVIVEGDGSGVAPLCRVWFVPGYESPFCYEYPPIPGQTNPEFCSAYAADPCRPNSYLFYVVIPNPGNFIMFSFEEAP